MAKDQAEIINQYEKILEHLNVFESEKVLPAPKNVITEILKKEILNEENEWNYRLSCIFSLAYIERFIDIDEIILKKYKKELNSIMTKENKLKKFIRGVKELVKN